MSYENNDFKLLDKVVYSYVDYNRPVEYEDLGCSGCSGAAIPIPNTHIEGVITKIVESKISYFSTGDEYDEFGEHTYYNKQYYINDLDKPLDKHQLKKL